MDTKGASVNALNWTAVRLPAVDQLPSRTSAALARAARCSSGVTKLASMVLSETWVAPAARHRFACSARSVLALSGLTLMLDVGTFSDAAKVPLTVS